MCYFSSSRKPHVTASIYATTTVPYSQLLRPHVNSINIIKYNNIINCRLYYFFCILQQRISSSPATATTTTAEFSRPNGINDRTRVHNIYTVCACVSPDFSPGFMSPNNLPQRRGS